MDDTTPRERPRRKPLLARVPAGFVQAVLKGHSGLGLAFAAAIYIVCLSGSLLVFYDEFIWWEAAGAPEIRQLSNDAIQVALTGAVERGGAEIGHIYATLPADDNPLLRIYVYAQEQSAWLADEAGQIVGPLETPWSAFLSGLHIFLHLPSTWGGFVVGMTGVALLSSLISGILAHPRIFRDAFHLRLGGSARLQEADLHNRIGVWGLPFHFIVSLSGAFLGLVTIVVGVLGMAMFSGDTGKIYDLFLPPEPADNPAAAPMIDIRPMLESRPSARRLERIELVHPTEQGGAVVLSYRDDRVLAGGAEYGFARDGEQYYAKSLPEATTGERIQGSLGPLHFGWFGGPIIKIVYFILGLGMTYLAVGGVNIWLARRRDKGRPAPGWERVWAAVVWSQPVTFGVVAAVALLLPSVSSEQMVAIWAAGTVLCLGLCAIMSARLLARAGKLATALLLAAIAIGHSIFRASGSSSVTVWAINAALLAGGLLLLASSRRMRSASDPV
ncbi:PepSY-associated TM helix domain-containing protein [Sphingosinithalassobacter sp. LHW66-3]|uniref:PepSY-associated TM helix domain-containing protein n=1 Tax=Sphingosinithalassobacter sp. LHW66-3 TaxID=3424718 RepID=UPI003D6B57A8